MSFTIYSIGDSAFLEQILIAVAMITGTGDFTRVVSIGLLLGVLLVCFQSIFGGAKQINIQHILVGWILYACMFGPSTTVTIEDAYTGQVRVVANVPVGVAFTGGMISHIGYKLTELFESGYGAIVPGITENSFAEPLKLLNDVRRETYTSSMFIAMNKSAGGGYVDIRRSWHNYIRECTLLKIDLKQTSVDKLINEPFEVGFKFESLIFGTRLYLDAANMDGEDVNCTEGWNGLMNNTVVNHHDVIATLNNLLGIDTYTGNNALTSIESALDAVGASGIDATTYTKAAILEPLYHDAVVGKYQDLQDFSSAMMVSQAIQQRNTQWAAEASLFMTTVRPLMTFFEGFVYAITPFVAFIVVMGSFGIQLAGRYLQTILWIQLWMPILSIINLFIHTAASNEMASYASNLSSMYALSSSSDILQNWIAVGGMMAAATPMLALFVVSGSTYTMNSLAGRISGGDHLNEKMTTPDITNRGPLLESSAAYDFNQVSGAISNGAAGLLGSMTRGSSISSSVASASTLQTQKSDAFQQALGRSFTDTANQSENYSRLSSLGRSIASQDTSQSQLIDAQTKQFMQKHGIDESHTEAVRGVMGLQAAAIIDGTEAAKLMTGVVGKAGKYAGAFLKGTGQSPKKGSNGYSFATKGSGNSQASPEESSSSQSGSPVSVKGQVQGLSESSSSDQTSWNSSDIASHMQNLQFSKTDAKQLTNQLAENFSRESGSQFQQTWGDSQSKTLNNTASALISASESYSQLAQLQDQMGSASQTDFKTLAGAVAQSPLALDKLANFYRYSANSDVKTEAVSLENRYRAYGMSPVIAQTAARLTAMTNANNYKNPHNPNPVDDVSNGILGAMDAINYATGRTGEVNREHESNSGLIERAEKIPEVTPSVKNAVGSGPEMPVNHRPNVQGTVAQSPISEASQLPTDSALISTNHDSGVNALETKAQNQNNTLSAPHIDKAWNNMLHALPEQSWASSQWGAVDNVGNWLQRKGETAGGAVIAGTEAASSNFSGAVSQLQTMTPEQRDLTIAAIDRGDQQVIDDLGWAGQVAVGAATIGRAVMGAAATGVDAASRWMGGEGTLSEAAQDMSLTEKGAFYAAAYATASTAGTEQAVRFMNEYGSEFKETMGAIAQDRYNLTPDQAAVFAEGFSTDQARMDAAVQNLKMQYAERNEDGSIKLDENNNPVLTAQNEERTDQLVNILQNASSAGDRAGSYLTAVNRLNIASKQFD